MEYTENGLYGIKGMEPTCPSCKHANAMLNFTDFDLTCANDTTGWNQVVGYICRDCHHVYIHLK